MCQKEVHIVEWYCISFLFTTMIKRTSSIFHFFFSKEKSSKIRTGASPGTFYTVSGTVRMVPAEDLKVHIVTTQRFDTAYYHLAVNKTPTGSRKNKFIPSQWSFTMNFQWSFIRRAPSTKPKSWAKKAFQSFEKSILIHVLDKDSFCSDTYWQSKNKFIPSQWSFTVNVQWSFIRRAPSTKPKSWAKKAFQSFEKSILIHVLDKDSFCSLQLLHIVYISRKKHFISVHQILSFL